MTFHLFIFIFNQARAMLNNNSPLSWMRQRTLFDYSKHESDHRSMFLTAAPGVAQTVHNDGVGTLEQLIIIRFSSNIRSAERNAILARCCFSSSTLTIVYFPAPIVHIHHFPWITSMEWIDGPFYAGIRFAKDMTNARYAVNV